MSTTLWSNQKIEAYANAAINVKVPRKALVISAIVQVRDDYQRRVTELEKLLAASGLRQAQTPAPEPVEGVGHAWVPVDPKAAAGARVGTVLPCELVEVAT